MSAKEDNPKDNS